MNAVDLKDFRALIGNNKILEQSLFRDFIETSNANLAIMRQSLDGRDVSAWKKNAHMMKGACRNLGAAQLADLLAAAESCSDDKKQDIYKVILDEFNAVKDFLASESS